jgi:hypothetical protein
MIDVASKPLYYSQRPLSDCRDSCATLQQGRLLPTGDVEQATHSERPSNWMMFTCTLQPSQPHQSPFVNSSRLPKCVEPTREFTPRIYVTVTSETPSQFAFGHPSRKVNPDMAELLLHYLIRYTNIGYVAGTQHYYAISSGVIRERNRRFPRNIMARHIHDN